MIEIRKIIIALGIILSSINIQAQKKYDSYNCGTFNTKYDLSVSKADDGVITLYVYVKSLDRRNKNVGFYIEESRIPLLIDKLNEAKEKYIEWMETAKINNVTELSKNINLNFDNANAFFSYYHKWKFDYSLNMNFKFKIFTSGSTTTYWLVAMSGKIQSESNEFMTHDGFALIFDSAVQIDDLIAKINVDKIKLFMDKPQKEDLFK